MREEYIPRQNQEDFRTVRLFGRFWAIISMLPALALVCLFVFVLTFLAVWTVMGDFSESFLLVLAPFGLASAVLLPFLVVFLYVLRWHGRRRLEMDEEGVTMVLPNERSVFVPWEFLLAVELRFNKPRLVSVTLVSSALRFSFSTLELNLNGVVAFPRIFKKGFELNELRELLYHLHQKSPRLSWRMGQSFKDQFLMSRPPYDLEKLRFHDSGSDR